MINYYNFCNDLHKKIPHVLQILFLLESDITNQHTKQVLENCNNLVTKINNKFKLSNSTINEIQNIELNEQLSVKYIFNNVSINKFGEYTDLPNMEIIQLRSMDYIGLARLQFYNNLNPSVYFIM